MVVVLVALWRKNIIKKGRHHYHDKPSRYQSSYTIIYETNDDIKVGYLWHRSPLPEANLRGIYRNLPSQFHKIVCSCFQTLSVRLFQPLFALVLSKSSKNGKWGCVSVPAHRAQNIDRVTIVTVVNSACIDNLWSASISWSGGVSLVGGGVPKTVKSSEVRRVLYVHTARWVAGGQKKEKGVLLLGQTALNIISAGWGCRLGRAWHKAAAAWISEGEWESALLLVLDRPASRILFRFLSCLSPRNVRAFFAVHVVIGRLSPPPTLRVVLLIVVYLVRIVVFECCWGPPGRVSFYPEDDPDNGK